MVQNEQEQMHTNFTNLDSKWHNAIVTGSNIRTQSFLSWKKEIQNDKWKWMWLLLAGSLSETPCLTNLSVEDPKISTTLTQWV